MIEPLRMDDTPKNRRYAEGLRAEIINAIARKTFDLAHYFPESRRVVHPALNADTIGAKLRAYELACGKAVAKGNMSAASLDSYRKVIHGHLLPQWDKTRLIALTTGEVRDWISLMDGTRKTINNILIPLRAVLDDAVTDGAIEFSPLAKLPLDRILDKTATESEYEPEPFNATEVKAILDAAGADRAMFQFAFFTGLRTSEYIALDWPAVNLDEGTARINKVRVARTDQDRTKTKAGMRTLQLMPPAVAALKSQAKGDRHVFLLNGAPWNSSKRVWAHWGAILKRAKVAYRNPYQTRHTFATMMLALGEVPLRVAHLLGHVDTEMVTRHYGRWIGVDTASVRTAWEDLIVELSADNFAQISRKVENAT